MPGANASSQVSNQNLPSRLFRLSGDAKIRCMYSFHLVQCMKTIYSLHNYNGCQAKLTVVVQKENGHTRAQTLKDIEEKLEMLQGKNSYFHNFQHDDVVKKKTADQTDKQKNAFGFNKVFEMEDEEEDFKKDSKYQHLYKLRKAREETKNEQHSITTSSQQLGWRQNYDTFTFGNNRSGMCHRTFADTGHL